MNKMVNSLWQEGTIYSLLALALINKEHNQYILLNQCMENDCDLLLVIFIDSFFPPSSYLFSF